MASVIGLRSFLIKVRRFPVVSRRLISTSKKNSDPATAAAVTPVEKQVETGKNWVSYGFDKQSEAADRNAVHSIFFASITLCMVFGGYILGYAPDYNLRDWAQREAFLELRRREQNGLPRVDPNLIDPALIHLPSDEELGDTEIII